MTIVAKIDRDYINKDDPEFNRVGMIWDEEDIATFDMPFGTTDSQRVLADAPRTIFRVLDDDEEVYYGGWLLNDQECIVQQIVLAWTMRDAGCTIIEVKHEPDSWEREIG